MNRQLFSIILSIWMVGFIQVNAQTTEDTIQRPDYVLVIHGGAGAMERAAMSAEAEKAYHEGLLAALNAG
ncbi:hypothetical protein RZS08_31880, partial [Arthrospira platensis SPKY1]|nr:hypothetical protein [Arthrospira platensis SPKY1]